MSTGSTDERWLAAFHAGERSVLEECYREHASRVIAAARRLLGSVDAETITHEVFYRLLSNPKMRESFRGGSLGAWLTQVAVRSAVDDLRRRRREAPADAASEKQTVSAGLAPPTFDDEVEAKMLVDRFRNELLPPEWASVFEVRFLRQLPQRDAASELGIPRTTLVYQEQRIRAMLQKFLLDEEE